MAESPGTYSAEQIDRLLSCAICLERFRNPKILPCQHTFCKSPCLEQLINTTGRLLRCPECRAEHLVPREGIDGFPTNITLSGFLDLPTNQDGATDAGTPSSSGSATKCGVCEAEAQTAKCFHCNRMVCSSCRRSHAGQMKLDIGRMLNQIRKDLPKLSTSISSVEQKSEQTKARVEAVKSEVADTIERYAKELKDREKILKSELEAYLQGELRSLRIIQENVEVELASISSFCDSTERLMTQADSEILEAELMSIKQQCNEYAEQIRNTESDPVPTQLREVSFTFDGQQLHSSIVGFGQLNIVTPGTLSRSSTDAPTSNSTSRNGQSAPPNPRTRWTDVDQQTSARFFADQTDTPRSGMNSPQYSRTPNATHYRSTYSSFFPESPSPRLLPSRTNDYMFRMASPVEEDMLDIMDRNRREEISRRRVNRNPLFSMEGRGRARDRVPGLMGGYGDTSSVVARGRGITPSATSTSPPWAGDGHAAYAPDQSAHATMSAPPAARAAAEAAERRAAAAMSSTTTTTTTSTTTATATTAAATATEPARTTEARPAAAFIVPLDGGPVQELQRGQQQQQQQQAGQSAQHDTQQQQQNTQQQNGRPPAGRQRAVGRRHRHRGRNRNNASHRRHHSRSPTDNGPSEQDAARQATTGQRHGSDQSEPASTSPTGNVNNNSSADSTTAPTTSADDGTPAGPGLGSRSRTFVRETDASNASGLPVVNGASTSFDVALTETIGDVDTSELTGISVQDSARGSRPINNYQMKGVMKRKLGGERGNARGQFTWPRGVAVSPVNDSILVADSSNHRVQMFDLDGNFVSMFGSYGQNSGEFDCLAGVAVDRTGQIVIADRYNHRIQVFDRYGQFSHRFGEEGTADGQMSYPWGVACDEQGFIYVCDKENHRVQVFQADGTFVRKFGGLGGRAGQLENPHYVTVRHDGDVIVSDCNNHRLQVFTSTGHFVNSIGSFGSDAGQLKYPKGVAVDRQGFIIVADSGNNRIQVFRADGRYYSAFGSWGNSNGQFKGLEGVAVTNNGDVVVSDKENHRIQIF